MILMWQVFFFAEGVATVGKRIEWVIDDCKLLSGTARDFDAERASEGLTIGTSIHLKPKTAALSHTLKRGPARAAPTGAQHSCS